MTINGIHKIIDTTEFGIINVDVSDTRTSHSPDAVSEGQLCGAADQERRKI